MTGLEEAFARACARERQIGRNDESNELLTVLSCTQAELRSARNEHSIFIADVVDSRIHSRGLSRRDCGSAWLIEAVYGQSESLYLHGVDQLKTAEIKVRTQSTRGQWFAHLGLYAGMSVSNHFLTCLVRCAMPLCSAVSMD